jgi:hypothetical protein
MRFDVFSGLFGILLSITVGASAASPPPDQTVFSPAELRADFAQMYRSLEAAHFNLNAFTPKRELDERYAQLHGQINRPMTRFEAKILFELFAADVRMGHTRVDSPTAD